MTTQPLLFYIIDFQVQILIRALKLVDFGRNCPLLLAACFWLLAWFLVEGRVFWDFCCLPLAAGSLLDFWRKGENF